MQVDGRHRPGSGFGSREDNAPGIRHGDNRAIQSWTEAVANNPGRDPPKRNMLLRGQLLEVLQKIIRQCDLDLGVSSMAILRGHGSEDSQG